MFARLLYRHHEIKKVTNQKGGLIMTQEWFESADFEKTANNEKKNNPSDSVIHK